MTRTRAPTWPTWLAIRHVAKHAIAGSLTTMSLPDLLQVLLTLQKSGHLSVHAGGRDSSLMLRDGMIVACRAPVSAPAALRDQVAATLLFAMHNPDGDFTFDSQPMVQELAPDPEASVSPSAALLDLARQLDEGARGGMNAEPSEWSPIEWSSDERAAPPVAQCMALERSPAPLATSSPAAALRWLLQHTWWSRASALRVGFVGAAVLAVAFLWAGWGASGSVAAETPPSSPAATSPGPPRKRVSTTRRSSTHDTALKSALRRVKADARPTGAGGR